MVILAGIAVGLVFFLRWSHEPTYQDRPISEWLDDWASGKTTDYYTAVREVGTDGLPYAVRSLARNDSKWHNKYRQLQPKFPKLLRGFMPAPKSNLKVVDGANVFFYLGSNSVPHAIALLKHPSPSVRQSAAWGLGTLRRQSAVANKAAPALIEALKDENRDVRFHAVLALKEMGADASNAVPAITKVLNTGLASPTNSSFYVQAAAALALGNIGPRALGALPDLKNALQVSYQDPPGFQHGGASYFRGQAAVAVWRISSDVETALPVLLREMPGISEHSKWDWIIALAEMGPRAKEAIPQLKSELMKDKEHWVLQYVTNALLKIDPQTAMDIGVK